MAKLSHSIDREFIQSLASLLVEKELSEVEVQQGDLRIRVARELKSQPVLLSPSSFVPHATETSKVASPASVHDATKNSGTTIPSPMVGTAYRAPEPKAKPFVEVGSVVEKGSTLLIIEAMKVMNPITAPSSGTITAILFDDGQPVEYGEALLIIE